MEQAPERTKRQQRAMEEALALEDIRLAREAKAAQVSPPAGWYAHPTMADTRRYWDGEQWTDHIAPIERTPAGQRPTAPSPAMAGSSSAKDETSFAWTIAFIPAIWLPVTYFAPGTAQSAFAVVGIYVATLTLVFFDEKRLNERGVHVTSSWALILVPAYLVSRTKRAGSTPAMPIAWFVTAGISILAMFTFAASYEFDGDVEGSAIERQMDRRGFAGVHVDCPSKTGHDGDTILCTVKDRQGNRGVLTVTLDSDTGYVWQMG